MVLAHSTPTPRAAFSIACCVDRVGSFACEDRRSWPPVAAAYALSTTTNTWSDLLKTAFPTPLVSPLCQKPPSPMKATVRSIGPGRAERRRAGRAQSVSHRCRTQLERGIDREQVTADVGAHVVGPGLALREFHAAEDRALWAAGAEARRPWLDDLGGLTRGANGLAGSSSVAQKRRLALDRVRKHGA